MASENLASEGRVSKKTSIEEPTECKLAAQDIKPSDAEENHNAQSPPGELKRKLKSRHLQMIAIGSFSAPHQVEESILISELLQAARLERVSRRMVYCVGLSFTNSAHF